MPTRGADARQHVVVVIESLARDRITHTHTRKHTQHARCASLTVHLNVVTL